MFKIGEFSRLTQVSIRMLRYYDAAGLLPPAKTDPQTGYRLYAAGQIPTLNRIKFLRDLGFSVAEIAEALEHWDDNSLAARLDRKRAETEGAFRAMEARLAKLERAEADIRRAELDIHCNVTLRAVPGCDVLSLRRVVPDYYAEGALWQELSAFAEERGVPISDRTFTIYHDPDYRERDVDIELCAPVSRPGRGGDGFAFRRTEPVPVMACTMVQGPFDRIAGAFSALALWLEQHGRYRMTGPTRQIVHRGPWDGARPEDYLTEMQIPLDSHTVSGSTLEA